VANEMMTDIVVVDDNLLLADVLAEIVRECGCTVRTASDGFGALAAIRDRVPDILISDLNMPRMTGFELLSIVRRRFPTIVVIAMNGAYSGMTVPVGVAADGFYAKGSSSVARILDLLRATGDEAGRHSARAAAPIWIPGVPIDERGLSNVAVACPECLRTFSHYLQSPRFSFAECRCPHCQYNMQLPIATPPAGMDHTTLSFSATANRRRESVTRGVA
jgi:CheY-like chemotaxis protein